ncbi:hypothetical protein PGS1_09340 [Enterobacter cloacae subsp. cloacae GS1]|nr:hypothetical protein PGS1_09340 [Enterobacter cloacae subsp. cloacae GS1]
MWFCPCCRPPRLSCWPPGASPARRRVFTTGFCTARGSAATCGTGKNTGLCRPGAKPRAIAFILITFAVSLWLVKMMWVRILLLAILVCLLLFMWRIPVVDEKQQKH